MKRLFGWTAMLAVCLAGAAPSLAAPPEADGPAIQLPLDEDLQASSLTSVPDNDDLQHSYPPIPLLLGLGGLASMKCTVTTEGSLANCQIVDETPAGLGFGRATLQTAPLFRVTPATRNGRPVEGAITIPLKWQTGSEAGKIPPPLKLAPADRTSLVLAKRLLTLSSSDTLMKAYADYMRAMTPEAPNASPAAKSGRIALLTAFDQGIEDAIDQEQDRRAHELAAHLSQADLRAAVAFYETPAGRALVAAQARAEVSAPKDMPLRYAAAVRARYCAKAAC